MDQESDFYTAANSPGKFKISEETEAKLKLLREQLSKNSEDLEESKPEISKEQLKEEIINPIFKDQIEAEIEADKPRILMDTPIHRFLCDKEYFKVELIFDPQLNMDPLSLLILDITPVSELLIFARVHVKNIGRWSTLELLCRNDKTVTENSNERMFPVSTGKLIMEVYKDYGVNNFLKIFCFLQNAFG